MPRCGRCTLTGGKKYSKKRQTKKKKAGTIWSTIRHGSKDIKDCYSGKDSINASINIGPSLTDLPNSFGERVCEDYYMGVPGNSGAKYAIDNCNRLVYSNPESWARPGHKKLFYCRKGENRTGQCRTKSFNRDEVGECSKGSFHAAWTSAKLNDIRQIRTNRRLEEEEGRAVAARLPTAVGMSKREQEEKKLLTEMAQQVAKERADKLFDQDLAIRLEKLRRGGKTRKYKRKLR